MTTARSQDLHDLNRVFSRSPYANHSSREGLTGSWLPLFCFFLLCCCLPSGSVAQSLTTLHSFSQSDGDSPYGTLVQGADGDFYGTTQFGGAYSQGDVYKVTSSGDLTILYNFCSSLNCSDGSQPFAGLVLGKDGNFYGTTLGTVFKITPSGTLSTLYTFCSLAKCADGNSSYGPLVQGTDGNFYGTTYYGGLTKPTACGGQCGTIFKITPAGLFTTLYSFPGNVGYNPLAGLVQGKDGSLYGTASNGGRYGEGVVFRISSTGVYRLVHSFNGNDGCRPDDKLIQGADGNFYGTTRDCGAYGGGTVFKITAKGNFTTLISFTSATGNSPFSGLLQASDGNFYGTTYYGGNQNSSVCAAGLGCGSIFQLTPAGQLNTLYEFCSQSGCSDGAAPFAGLIQGTDGKLYGTTNLGGMAVCGATGSCGTVFSLSLGLPASKH